jgi:acetolactate synthase-1/2/3 large subunit
VQLGDYDIAHYAAAFGAKGIRVGGMSEFEAALKQSLNEPGITVIDVVVDYSRNTELFAELHEDAVE